LIPTYTSTADVTASGESLFLNKIRLKEIVLFLSFKEYCLSNYKLLVSFTNTTDKFFNISVSANDSYLLSSAVCSIKSQISLLRIQFSLVLSDFTRL